MVITITVILKTIVIAIYQCNKLYIQNNVKQK